MFTYGNVHLSDILQYLRVLASITSNCSVCTGAFLRLSHVLQNSIVSFVRIGRMVSFLDSATGENSVSWLSVLESPTHLYLAAKAGHIPANG